MVSVLKLAIVFWKTWQQIKCFLFFVAYYTTQRGILYIWAMQQQKLKSNIAESYSTKKIIIITCFFSNANNAKFKSSISKCRGGCSNRMTIETSIITVCNKSNRNTQEITVITIKHNLVKHWPHQTINWLSIDNTSFYMHIKLESNIESVFDWISTLRCQNSIYNPTKHMYEYS